MNKSPRERQRIAYETLVSPEFDIGVFAGIARVVAQGLGFRGAGVARLVDDGAHLETLGLWFDGAVVPSFKFTLAGTPCQATLCHADSIMLIDNGLSARFQVAGAFEDVALESYYGVPLRDDDGSAIGMLYAVDDQPHHGDPNEEALMKVAAARARAELLREVSAEKIRESEERMRFALEAGALGMWEWDLAADTWVYNDRWAEMRGYRQGEIVPVYVDGHPQDNVRVLPLVNQLLAGQIESYEIEYRTPHRNGEFRWINSRTKIMKRDADGRPLRIVGVQMDIHARRLAEEAARANQQWLELTLEATELGVWDWNAGTDQMVWSERCASMLGYRIDEMPARAREWVALHHREDLENNRRQFIGHLKGEVPQLRLELRCRAKDGRWVWVLINGRVTERDAQGRALRAVGTHQDISQLKNAELALRESEARLRTVVENSPIGIFLASANGNIVYCNPIIIAMRNNKEPGENGYAWLHAVHPDDLARVTERWQAFIAAPDGVYDLEWRAIMPDGRRLVVRVRAVAIREQERVLGFAGTFEDITERRAAEQRERALEIQLQQTQKVEAIGKLTGGVAHDFNNSLATILGFATLALGRPSTDAKLGGYLETIVQAAEHSRDLVRKLLDFSRSTPAGEVAALDAAPRIVDAVHMLKAVIPATLRIATEIDDKVPPVRIDATDLHQLLFNLVLNARDAIDGHGEITVSLHAPRDFGGSCTACHRELDGEYVELAVRDSGCGIPGESLPRIFEPFYSTKEVGKGTGMGLSVLHGIVHRVSGHVLVNSMPGVGTVMRVLLRAGGPLADSVATPAPDACAAQPTHARQMCVLVVDDEPSIVRFLCEWLEVEGFLTAAFTDPLAAREWAARAEADFDVLVTDQTMPAMTGLELARALREQRADLPVIVCTGLADRVSASQANELGVAQLFLKPVPMPELLQTLRRVTAGADASSAAS